MKYQKDGMTRVNFELNETTMTQLRKMKKLTGASSYAEVLRNALRDHEKALRAESASNLPTVAKRGRVEERLRETNKPPVKGA